MARRPKTTLRKRPRQERAQATVQALLEATARVLVREGYEGCSTNRVAAAGVSIGSLYQYFPSKEALIAELLEHYTTQFQTLVLGYLEREARTEPRIVAAALVRMMVELKRGNPKLARVLREQIPRVGRMNRYEENLDRIGEAVVAYLLGHPSALRHPDPERLGDVVYVVVHTVDSVTHQGVVQERDAERLVADVTDMIVRFLFR